MPPRWLTPVPDEDIDRGHGVRVGQFIEAVCTTTKKTVSGPAGKPMTLLPWQWDLLGRLYAVREDGRRRHRTALIGVPRKNGKSGLASGLALYHLLMEDKGAEVYSCAADRLQAKIVFGEASKMIEANPELAGMCKVYRDAIEVTGTGSVYRALSSEAYTKEGLSPSAVFVDEVHALPRRDLWDVMALAMGARVDPLMVATTTAGVRTDVSGGDSICYQLYQYLQDIAGGHIQDDRFYGEWWASNKPVADVEGDIEANPSYGELVDPEDFESVKQRTPEAEYMTKRRNLFVATAEHWFPEGVFEDLADATQVVGERPVVLGFDGSVTQDCTAIVGCTADGDEHLFVVDVWERPRDAHKTWTVPSAEVLESMRQACARLNVREIAIDPAFWRERMELFAEEGYPVVEFSQQSAHMVQATSGFQQAVIDKTMSHDGDRRLVLHVRNCHVEPARGGIKVRKAMPLSSAKIDSAVAGIMARHRAVFYAEQPKPHYGAWVA